jgi:O-antigen/teichoic acid export membrane protein
MSNFPSQGDLLDPTTGLPEEATATAAAAAAAAAAAHGASTAATTQAAHRAERARRIKLSVVTSLLFRPLSFVIPIVTIPLFLQYLGKARYGLYESVGALAAWLGMTNLGLGMGLMNRLIECDVAQDRQTARVYNSTFTLAMTAIVLVSSIVFFAVVWFVPWHVVLGADDPAARAETTMSVLIAGLITFVGLLCTLPGIIYVGYQETHRANIWDGMTKLVTLVACILVVRWPNLGVPGVLIASLAVPTFIRLGNFADMLLREKPWLRPSLRLFDWQALKWMAAQGLLLFVLQMSTMLLFQTDKLIIAAGLNSEEVTGYAVLGRIFLMGYGIFMLFLIPIWPAMGEAVRRNDVAWVSSTVRRLSMLGMGMMLAAGAVLLVARGPMSNLLARLAGGPVNVSVSLILAITATFVTRAWVDSRSIVLNATNVLMPQIPFYAGHAVLNAAIAIAVVRRLGVEGVVWATPLTALVTSVWGYPWMIRRYIVKRPAAGPAREA